MSRTPLLAVAATVAAAAVWIPMGAAVVLTIRYLRQQRRMREQGVFWSHYEDETPHERAAREARRRAGSSQQGPGGEAR